jgi:3-deoxy-manno-octulosonate cytidylyltransferase (CMP-KDO synthetase)
MSVIQTLAVIPARLRSVRLPEKPLIKLGGRELVLWVWEGVNESRKVDRVIVATDDQKIASLVERAGGEAIMTPDAPTGNDRVAYVARQIPSRFVLNVQGDDPMVSAAVIDPMIDALAAHPEINLAVLAKKIDDPTEIAKDSIVKMVFDQSGRALYFSRSPIPFARNGLPDYYKHIGPYAWRRDALLEFAACPQTPLERCESLEMLRLLERGRSIMCIKTAADSIEIDTPDDVRAFEEYYRREE